MDRATNDHRGADATELGNECATRVIDDCDRSRPEAQVGRAGFEESFSGDDDELRTLEFVRIRKRSAAFFDPNGELRQESGELREFAAVLEEHDPILCLFGYGLSHEVALPLLASTGRFQRLENWGVTYQTNRPKGSESEGRTVGTSGPVRDAF